MSYLPSAFSGPEDKNAVPVTFQVLSPNKDDRLLPHELYLHVNPNSFDLSYSKKIARSNTKGGYMEQYFGEELTSISAEQSTGVFIHTEKGLTVRRRQETPAWKKMDQLIGIFKSNGSVFDDRGTVRFRGRIRLMFHGGVYDGFFTSFEITHDPETPFNFELSWDFNVEKEAYNVIT
jgi:hypothetical protein